MISVLDFESHTYWEKWDFLASEKTKLESLPGLLTTIVKRYLLFISHSLFSLISSLPLSFYTT